MTDLPAPPNEGWYPLDLPAWLALNAPEPDLDVIYEHVKRITGESRTVISSNLHSPRGQTQHGSYGRNVNVHGTPFYQGRKATFVVQNGPRERNPLEDYLSEYGWEVCSPIVLDDGSRYRSTSKDDDGSIQWHRLD